MAPIYSTKLTNSSVVGPFSSGVYVVPAGATVVVTDIDLYRDIRSAGQVSYVQLGQAIMLFVDSPGTVLQNDQWTGKQVLNEGDVIVFVMQGHSATIAITGYLLQP